MRVDWFLYHVASGHAFFSGMGLIAVAVVLAATRTPVPRRGVSVLVLVGVLLAAISATPLPWFVYAITGVAVAAGLYAETRRDRLSHDRLVLARSAAVVSIVVAVSLEVPYHLPVRLEPQSGASLAVIGDSVTAGIGENEAVTWPRLIARRQEIGVRDLSAMGATVSSARNQADGLHHDDTIVVLEIGGNDLLGETSVSSFSTGLESLLRRVCRPGRTVVMFELPLPPTFNAYGRVQRRLAARYEVVLIPKRVLMGVLTGRDATLDTIHLSPHGHERLAEAVWDVVGPAFVDAEDR
ncbi:MAG: GDSL-type esterase/lipase family protein [Planctomycetaceae bacterium]